MSRFHTEQERIDALTMQIENPNVVGSGYVRYPPQRPVSRPLPHQSSNPSNMSYPGGMAGRQGHGVHQAPPRGVPNLGPSQMQSLHHFNPAAQQRFVHQAGGHVVGGPNPLGPNAPQPAFSSRPTGAPAPYRPQEIGPHQGGMYHQPQMAGGGVRGFHADSRPVYHNGMGQGLMGRAMRPGMVPPGMAPNLVPRPGYHMHQSLHSVPPLQSGVPSQGGYPDQGLEQTLQPGLESRVIENGLPDRQQHYQIQAPGLMPVVQGPSSSGHHAKAFQPQGNGQQLVLPQQQPIQHIRTPQPSASPSSLEKDGSRSPAVNYQPPPPHKAPAPIGTPLPGSLGAKTSPQKPVTTKQLPMGTVGRPAQPAPSGQGGGSQPPRRGATSKTVQSGPMRTSGAGALPDVASSVEDLPNQVTKSVPSNGDQQKDPAEGVEARDEDSKQGLTKRQKTRLRKKTREQHLRQNPQQKGVGA